MVKNLCKKLTPGFKNHMRNLDNFRQAVVQKVEIQYATFVKKFIPSAKTLYKEGLSNITTNYLCKNAPHSLCHFWNHMSFFTTQLVYIILAQTLHTFDKNIPSECRFFRIFRFFTAQVKIHEISLVIFQTKSELFFKLWITVQCHER